MTSDISYIDGLSSIGLLADKVRVELDRVKNNSEKQSKDRQVFLRAANYLACAMHGLQRIGNLEVDQNTAFAIDAYETVREAVPPPNAEDVKQMMSFIEKMRAMCDQLARSIPVDDVAASAVDSFFSSLSAYTREQRKVILQESSVSMPSGTLGYAY